MRKAAGTKNPHHKQLLSDDEMQLLKGFIRDLKFIPGGRYLYYAGRTRQILGTTATCCVQRRTRARIGRTSRGRLKAA